MINLKVHVTGFGPFAGHPTNPSWLAVSRLPDEIVVATSNTIVHLTRQQLPVDYRFIDGLYGKQLPQLLQSTADLVIHVGVSAQTNKLLLERQAFNESRGLDVCGYKPAHGRVDPSRPPGETIACPLGTKHSFVCLFKHLGKYYHHNAV